MMNENRLDFGSETIGESQKGQKRTIGAVFRKASLTAIRPTSRLDI